jgi:hypothetical protein
MKKEEIIKHIGSFKMTELVEFFRDLAQTVSAPFTDAIFLSDYCFYNNDEEFFQEFFSEDILGAIKATERYWHRFNDYVKFKGTDIVSYSSFDVFQILTDQALLEKTAEWIEKHFNDTELKDYLVYWGFR